MAVPDFICLGARSPVEPKMVTFLMETRVPAFFFCSYFIPWHSQHFSPCSGVNPSQIEQIAPTTMQ